MNTLIATEKIEYFWGRVEKTESCWNWLGNVSTNGYGTIRVNGKNMSTHRFSFFLSNGYLPSSDMDIMHICDNKICVNPSHLKVGTRRENILDFISKGGKYGKSGENNKNSKLTDAQYLEIKNRVELGECVSTLAKEYGLRKQSLFERLERESR